MEASDEGIDGEENEEVEVSAEENEEVSAEAEGEQEAEVEAEAEVEEVEQELKEEIEEAAEAEYSEPAPERWPDEIRQVYDALPPNARKAMLEGIYKPMQQSYTRSTQELAQMRNELAPFVQVLDQFKGDFERTGADPVEVIKAQVAWAAHFQRVGAEQGLLDMQQAYGVGGQQVGQEGNNQYLTPTERAFKQQIDALQAQVQGQATATTTQERQRQIDAQRAEINLTLQNFVNEKTEDGNPKHPHIDRVASNIAGIIKGGLIAKADEWGNPVPLRDQIAQAYNMACNLDPAIRTPAVNPRQAKRVKAAQKVSVVTKHPANQAGEDDDLDIGSFIEKTYDQLASRS
jgi:hypothetical protein